jgi:glycerol-3-phosphate dehydrogenase (NAD(P)+)
MRSEEAVQSILNNKHNPSYLSDVEIDLNKVVPTSDLQSTINDCELIILAVPSAFLESSLAQISKNSLEKKVVFSAIKGIVPGPLLIVGEYIHRHFEIPYDQIGVITGPCHAEEVALEKLSYLTLACKNTNHAALLASLMNCRYIRTTVSDDIYGTEYAAVIMA